MSNLNPNQFGAPYFPGNDPSKASQGKLFRDPKPVDAVRYQRGYTPERMQEVQGMALKIHTGQKGPFTGPVGAHHVREIIARSTTPASEHQPQFNGDEGLRIHTGEGMRGSAAAFYRHPSFGEPHGSVHLGRTNPASEGQYLMHELGHYRSLMVEGTEHSAVSTPRQRGQEEAFADDNMMTRWRADPRDLRKTPGARYHQPHPSYEYEQSWKGVKGMGLTGFRAYKAARTTPNVKESESARHRARNVDAAYQPSLDQTSDDPRAHLGSVQFRRY